MFLTCWYCNVEPLADPTLFSRGLSRLPWAERREQVMRFRLEKDRRLCLGAGLLLAHALRDAGISDMCLGRLSNGKPILKNSPDVHFNLSHSGTLAVCAVSDQPVGADVERLQKADAGVAALCFQAAEQEWIFQSAAPDREFTRLWTRKESYLKLIGTGLFRSPGAFSVLPGSGRPEGVRFFETAQNEPLICVCTEENEKAVFREWQLPPDPGPCGT